MDWLIRWVFQASSCHMWVWIHWTLSRTREERGNVNRFKTGVLESSVSSTGTTWTRRETECSIWFFLNLCSTCFWLGMSGYVSNWSLTSSQPHRFISGWIIYYGCLCYPYSSYRRQSLFELCTPSAVLFFMLAVEYSVTLFGASSVVVPVLY